MCRWNWSNDVSSRIVSNIWVTSYSLTDLVNWRRRPTTFLDYGCLRTWLKSSLFFVFVTYFNGFTGLCMYSRTAELQGGKVHSLLRIRQKNETETEALIILQHRLLSPRILQLPTNKPEREIYGSHRLVWPASQLQLIAGASWRTGNACEVLVTFDREDWRGIRQSTEGVPPCLMGRLTVETVSLSVAVYYSNGPRCVSVDTRQDWWDRKPGEMALQLTELDFQVVHRASVKPQAAKVISCLPTTEMDDYTLDDGVPVLILTEVLLERGNTKADMKMIV